MYKMIKSSTEERFSVKFKGTVYDDAWEDASGHIWFGGNEFEYVPANSLYRRPFVNIHGFKQQGNTYTHTNKTSTAKVEILK